MIFLADLAWSIPHTYNTPPGLRFRAIFQYKCILSQFIVQTHEVETNCPHSHSHNRTKYHYISYAVSLFTIAKTTTTTSTLAARAIWKTLSIVTITPFTSITWAHAFHTALLLTPLYAYIVLSVLPTHTHIRPPQHTNRGIHSAGYTKVPIDGGDDGGEPQKWQQQKHKW